MAVGKVHSFCVILIALFAYTSGDYIAAVVEYQPIILSSPNATVEKNLQEYVLHIENAKAKNAQIIVFPEYGLTGVVTDPAGYAIEIPNVGNGTEFENYWLQKLSNAARSNPLYIVVNLLEKSVNAVNKTVYYSTSVVFDKNGKIAAKCRKINLFTEPELTPGASDENQVTFETDFGITFGVFSSFDIVYDNPSRTILSKNVTDIVYPTAWTSYLPYLHSLTTQAGYAVANKVNLLASGLDIPEVGIGGSGIWGSDGTVFSHYISGNAGTKLLIANVKNTPDMRVLGERTLLGGFNSLDDEVNSIEKYNASRYFEHGKYTLKTINISRININDEVCHKAFCCQFSINASFVTNSSEETYKIMAYNGPLEILTGQNNYKVCSLIGCATSDINTCGKNGIQLTTKFQGISVSTSITGDSRDNYRPISLTTNLVPVLNGTFNRVIVNSTRKVINSNQLEQSNVLVFGVLEIRNSTATATAANLLLIFVFIVNRMLF